ncbi:MAG TPA: M1 family metallopeptidase [Anaerolineales bacterium]|nr:M1 family metallopeptidase [Anaerolineales bacterium]
MKKIFLLLMLALLLLPACLPARQAAESTPQQNPNPTPDPADRSIYKDGLTPAYQSVLNELPTASLYEIHFTIEDDLYHVKGHETVIYTNAEDSALNEVKFRLFPNILGGEMHVDEVDAGGTIVVPNYTLDDSLLTVPLKQPLQPKESITLSMGFTVTVPQSVELNYGVQAYFNDVLTLAHAYPMIAVYDDEGWNAEIPPQSGDVTYADMSFFNVTVDAPKDLVLVSVGREILRQAERNGNRQTVQYVAGPVRDYYLAASPNYEVVTKESNGVTLRFYAPADQRSGAERTLEIAAKSIEVYENRYAAYPYTELDFVSTPTLALGIEYPGMIAIADRIVSPYHEYLEGTVAHEVGHQWFYNLVGNDQLDDPWLDESLTQFATLQYFSDQYGQSGYEGFRFSLEGRWARTNNAAIPVGMPVRDYKDIEYGSIVYGRGGLFFEALRDEMGSENFDQFIKVYVGENAWGIATPEKMKQLAEQNCTCDLTDLFKSWIYP